MQADRNMFSYPYTQIYIQSLGSSFCTCVEYIMLGLVLFHSDFFFFFFFFFFLFFFFFVLFFFVFYM